MTTRVGRLQDRGGLFLILLFCLWIGPATVARADTISYTGNLRTDATVTGCGMGCTLGPANTDADYAQWAAVVTRRR